MGKSMEKALGILPTLLGGFICFAVMDLTGAGTGLSNAKIFSTMGSVEAHWKNKCIGVSLTSSLVSRMSQKVHVSVWCLTNLLTCYCVA